MILKTLKEIEKIAKANQLVAEYLQLAIDVVECEDKITTLELDHLAELFTRDSGAVPAFKGYKGFPYSICSSINSEVVHGMPSNKPLQKGDILSIDFGILLDGYYGDSAITIPVGKVSKEAESLIKVGQECLYRGIKQTCEGARLNQISHAIQQHAESNGYGVVRKFVGHGIGKNLHELPQIPNFTKKPNDGIILKRGAVLAIEPMIVAGSYKLLTESDGWTTRTKDGKLAVHWEHTVAITESGPKILSLREDEIL